MKNLEDNKIYYSILVISGFVIAALTLFILSNTILKSESKGNIAGLNTSTIPFKVNLDEYSYEITQPEFVLENNNIQFENFFSKLPFKLVNTYQDAAYISQGIVKDCNFKSIYIDLDKDNLKTKIINSLETNSINLSFSDLSNKNSQLKVLNLCKTYWKDRSILENKIQTLGIKEGFDNYFQLDQNLLWSLNKTELNNYLQTRRLDTLQEFSEGKYEVVNNKVFVLENAKEGKRLNVEKTMKELGILVSDLTYNFKIINDSIKPNLNFGNKKVYDFTKSVGIGKTRIDLIRNGQGNAAVYFAELGLQEIQNTVIMPKQEFSFVRKISKQKGINYTAAGRLIGYGYCNSTTTIFRAALETGLPITDRSEHGFIVPSYDWGYPMNIVDAAYWGVEGQEVDLKFINDFDYPILLRFESTQDGNGFQFHTVKVLSSSEATKRKVQLYDWRKWNQTSAIRFDGAFKRRVLEGSKILREDEFISRYR